ncbi:hypothetical protein EDD16DRAFT_1523440 [Pisolithus croceorrhizus]|nr:hypothetical protein EDD16DRAFT_1523440 [Pisolithus croceorrhizus]
MRKATRKATSEVTTRTAAGSPKARKRNWLTETEENIKAWASTSYWEHWVGLVDDVKGGMWVSRWCSPTHSLLDMLAVTNYAVDDDIGEPWGLVLADGVVVTIVRYFKLFREDTADEGGNMTGDFHYDK